MTLASHVALMERWALLQVAPRWTCTTIRPTNLWENSSKPAMNFIDAQVSEERNKLRLTSVLAMSEFASML